MEELNSICKKNNYNIYIFKDVSFTDASKNNNNNINIDNNNGIIGVVGQNSAPVTINSATEKKLSEHESALLEFFLKLDVIKQAQLLTFAANLEKEVKRNEHKNQTD